MADELRLKVTQSEYQTRLAQLDSKMSELEAIRGEYETLRLQATRVLGDSDTNLEKLQATVQQNIQAVEGQHQMLNESRQMLEKQNEELGMTSTAVSELLQQTMETAKTALKTIKIVGDIVG